MRISDKIKKYY